MTTILALAVALVGLLMWCLLPGRAADIGRTLFAIGAFWSVGVLAGEHVRLLRG